MRSGTNSKPAMTAKHSWHVKNWDQIIQIVIRAKQFPQNLTIFTIAHTPFAEWVNSLKMSISKLTIIGSDNGLAPTRWHCLQTGYIVWTNAAILLIWPLQTELSEVFSFKKIQLNILPIKCRPFYLGHYGLMALHNPKEVRPWGENGNDKQFSTHKYIDNNE